MSIPSKFWTSGSSPNGFEWKWADSADAPALSEYIETELTRRERRGRFGRWAVPVREILATPGNFWIVARRGGQIVGEALLRETHDDRAEVRASMAAEQDDWSVAVAVLREVIAQVCIRQATLRNAYTLTAVADRAMSFAFHRAGFEPTGGRRGRRDYALPVAWRWAAPGDEPFLQAHFDDNLTERERTERHRQPLDEGDRWWLLACAGEDVVGEAMLQVVSDRNPRVGFSIAGGHRGRGLATATLRGLVAMASQPPGTGGLRTRSPIATLEVETRNRDASGPLGRAGFEYLGGAPSGPAYFELDLAALRLA